MLNLAESPAKATVNQGGLRLAQGDLDGAEKLYREAILIDPGNATAHANLGYLLAARGLGVSANTCLVFEDAVVGVQAALRAGMRAVGVATAYEPADLLAAGAERVIGTFEGLTWPL